MNTYIFMFIVTLITPITMIVIGFIYKNRKHYPKINNISGYRTNRSMKNRETWIFAHKYFGKLSLYIGIINLIISVIIMILIYNKSDNFIYTTGLILTIIQVIFLIIPIIPTEKALKKNFDDLGNKKINKNK